MSVYLRLARYSELKIPTHTGIFVSLLVSMLKWRLRSTILRFVIL
uniref:Uncharacterized protein n=1 Tax=Arundo donax TaxID=35708 RepID=A0A0A9B5I3_ARUDO